ncbi:hypothetical protein ABEY43_06935 [Priestia megaterium]
MKEYWIKLDCSEGCTIIPIALTEEEYKLVKRIEKLSYDNCDGHYLPTLDVYEKD